MELVSEKNISSTYWTHHTDVFKKSIVIDWFEIFGKIDNPFLWNNPLKHSAIDKWSFPISKNYHVEYVGYGTSTFEQYFKVIKEDTLIGALYTMPKIKSGHFKPDSMGFQMSNNFLYTDGWIDVLLDFMEETKFEFNNITRMDIALDGANHVMKFFSNFTAYRVIEGDNHYIQKAGRAKMFPKAMDKEFKYFEGFQVGGRKSERHLIIYNKSKEIEARSHKPYIKEYWKKCGIDEKYFDYMIRVEVVIKGKLLTGFKVSDFKLLNEKEVLFTLFKTHTQNYLDFRFSDDSVVTRCTPYNLIDYTDVVFKPLPMAEIKERDGLYSIKQNIRITFELMCKGLDNGYLAQYIETMKNNIMLYGLEEWYEKRRERWRTILKCHEQTGHIYDITDL